MLIRNTLLMGGTTVVRLMAGFVVFVLVARHLGVVGFGTFIYWVTVTSLVGLFVGFGTNQYMLKELGARPEFREAIVGGVGALKVALTLFAIGCSLLAKPLLGDDGYLYWILLVMAISDVFSEYLFCGFRGAGDYLTEVWVSSLTATVHLGLIWWAVLLNLQLLQIAIIFAFSRALALVVIYILYRRRFGRLGIVKLRYEWISTLLKNKSYAADSILTNLYSQADNLILHYFSGPAVLGVYQAGMRLLQGLNNISPVLANVYLPKLAGEIHSSQSHKQTATFLYIQLVGFGAFVALIFSVLSVPITYAIYGAKYSSLSNLLPWMGLLLLFRLFSSHFGILLTASGQQSTRAWAVLICLVVLVIGGVILVPKYGALGIVWSALAATVTLATIYYIRVMSSPANPQMNGNLLKVFIFVVCGIFIILSRHYIGIDW